MTQPQNSSEGGTRLYSDLEIDLLIDDLSEAAKEAIEKAAAALASVEREAAAMREASRQQAEAIRWRNEAETAKGKGIKNAILAGAICLLSGLAIGAGVVLIFGGR